MLLNPTIVHFGDITIDAVVSLTVDRLAHLEIAEHGDAGPHTAFADVPEIRTLITLTRRLERPDLLALMPGDMAAIAFEAAAGAQDSGRVRVLATAVVRDIRHAIADARGRSALQTITFIAVSSPDGQADPLTIEPL